MTNFKEKRLHFWDEKGRFIYIYGQGWKNIFFITTSVHVKK